MPERHLGQCPFPTHCHVPCWFEDWIWWELWAPNPWGQRSVPVWPALTPWSNVGLVVWPAGPANLSTSYAALKPYYFYLKMNKRRVDHMYSLLQGCEGIFLVTLTGCCTCSFRNPRMWAECLQDNHRSGRRSSLPLRAQGLGVLAGSVPSPPCVGGDGATSQCGERCGSCTHSGCRCAGRRLHSLASPWRVLVPGAEDLKGSMVSVWAMHCGVWGLLCFHMMGNSLWGCARCMSQILSNPHKWPLPHPKSLMELLWNRLPKSQGRLQGSKTISMEHTFSFSVGTFFFLFNQHHTMLPKATFHLSWITTVKYYSCTVPNLALACSDKTLYVFCMA